jgi:hypothetical protein
MARVNFALWLRRPKPLDLDEVYDELVEHWVLNNPDSWYEPCRQTSQLYLDGSVAIRDGEGRTLEFYRWDSQVAYYRPYGVHLPKW